MTDGTPVLIFRDPVSFEETGRVPVTLNGQDVFNLNEAECVDGVVWANIWQSNVIVRIDPATGVVTGVVDAFALDRPGDAGAFNGIAWDASTQSFYVTGKLWPTMYRVSFVPVATG
jgi:glutaminyl-peptide cyclotransferase